jgi:hypothetical protein
MRSDLAITLQRLRDEIYDGYVRSDGYVIAHSYYWITPQTSAEIVLQGTLDAFFDSVAIFKSADFGGGLRPVYRSDWNTGSSKRDRGYIYGVLLSNDQGKGAVTRLIDQAGPLFTVAINYLWKHELIDYRPTLPGLNGLLPICYYVAWEYRSFIDYDINHRCICKDHCKNVLPDFSNIDDDYPFTTRQKFEAWREGKTKELEGVHAFGLSRDVRISLVECIDALLEAGKPTIAAATTSNKRHTCKSAIVDILDKSGHRMTTGELLVALRRHYKAYSKSSVVNAGAYLTKKNGPLTNIHTVNPPGYGLKQWGNTAGPKAPIVLPKQGGSIEPQ